MKSVINICGICIPNRHWLLKNLPKLNKGYVDLHHKDVMLYEYWQDKREVRGLSTIIKLIDQWANISKNMCNKNIGDIGDMQLSFNVTTRK